MDADGLLFNFFRHLRDILIDADIGGIFVSLCQLPERILDNDRCIPPDAKLQVYGVSRLMLS